MGKVKPYQEVLCGCELAVHMSRNLHLYSKLVPNNNIQFFRTSLRTALRKLQFRSYHASMVGNTSILEYVDHGDTFLAACSGQEQVC